jgi:cytochrome c oxidase subunit 1/cytochrome c oxidase subunit I+III
VIGRRYLVEAPHGVTLATSWLDAEPQAIAKMPEDTITPFLLALGMAAVFIGLVLKLSWLALAGAIFTLVIGALWLWPQRQGELA